MSDPFKSIITLGKAKAAAKFADAAARAMAEHCDKRIENARKAIRREEKYLQKLLRSRTAGGVMRGDIEGAFHRLHAALNETPKRRRGARTSAQSDGAA